MIMVAVIIVRNPARGRPLVSSASRRSRYRVGIFQPPERVNVHNVLVLVLVSVLRYYIEHAATNLIWNVQSASFVAPGCHHSQFYLLELGQFGSSFGGIVLNLLFFGRKGHLRSTF